MLGYKFIPAPPNAASLSPAEARALFHTNDYGTTSGFCEGHAQANVVIIPSHLADDFEKCCRMNHGPFPLLYRSKPGEVGAPPLAKESDIKWDLPRYVVYSNGERVDDVLDLDGFSHMWSDMVCFYIGCSFSFEHELIKNGIELPNLKEGKNCSMYITNIMLKESGPFSGIRMAASMRPIPKPLLQTAVNITAAYPDHHGAPIHIGDPLRLGISDITKPQLGEWQVNLSEDSVFMFWACGVTERNAIASAKPKFAIADDSGSLFIADAKPEKRVPDESIDIVQLSRPSDPYFASIVGSKTIAMLSKLEESLLEDPNKRGVEHLFVKSDLQKAILSLSHAKRVAVTTGFPANLDLPVKQENDGISGALSICQSLLALGKQVSIISDQSSQDILEKCVQKMISLGGLQSNVPVVTFDKAKEMMVAAPKDTPAFDCLLAIERAGRSPDGSYRSMKKVDISAFVEPVDELFLLAASNQLVTTIGIGDGGNELGMGKVYEAVKENVQFGETIACQTPADFLISAGVSDWAGYAVSIGLYAVSQCPVHWRYVNHAVNAETPQQFELSAFLPSNDQVASLLEHMNDLGIMDGMTKGRGSVDSVPIATILEKVQTMKELIS